MLLPLLLATALAASPVQLPPGEAGSAWAEPLALAGLTLADPGVAPAVVLTADGGRWTIRVVAAGGASRVVVVPAPTTLQAREDLAWLVASLLQPVGVRADASLPRPAVPAAPVAVAPPRPSAPAPRAVRPPSVSAGTSGGSSPGGSPGAATGEASGGVAIPGTAAPVPSAPVAAASPEPEGTPTDSPPASPPPGDTPPGEALQRVSPDGVEPASVAGALPPSPSSVAPGLPSERTPVTGGAGAAPSDPAPLASARVDAAPTASASPDATRTGPSGERSAVGGWVEPTVALHLRPGVSAAPELGVAGGLSLLDQWRFGVMGGWEQEAALVSLGEGRTVSGGWLGLAGGWTGPGRVAPAADIVVGAALRRYAEGGEPVGDVLTPVAAARGGGRVRLADGLALRVDASVRCDLRPTDLYAPSQPTRVASPCAGGGMLGIEILAPDRRSRAVPSGSAALPRDGASSPLTEAVASARGADRSVPRQSTNLARGSGHEEGE